MPSATDNKSKKSCNGANNSDGDDAIRLESSSDTVGAGTTITDASTPPVNRKEEGTTEIGTKDKANDQSQATNVDDKDADANANANATVADNKQKEELVTATDDGDIKLPDSVIGTKKESALRELVQRTGFPLTQSNGQRRFGPSPEWSQLPPPRGCEVFVGKIPRDLFEDELVPVFEKVGKIYELRLMMDFSGNNRGYAFVVYETKAAARQCIKQLNNYEVRQGRMIGVCSSVDNCRLFIGGIPKTIKREDIMTEMSKITEEVVDVIVYPSASDKTKNRGFAFVEYTNHRAAAMARRKLMNSNNVELWGHKIAVDWAEPEIDVDEEIMDQVSC